jgi:hypothetical protein
MSIELNMNSYHIWNYSSSAWLAFASAWTDRPPDHPPSTRRPFNVEGCKVQQTIAVGDGANDIPMLQTPKQCKTAVTFVMLIQVFFNRFQIEFD